MKKIFVTVTLFVALATVANAAGRNNDNQPANAEVTNIETVNNASTEASTQNDTFRTYALQSEENDKHILRFYDINRIVVKNKNHAVIRIYDDKWRLLEQTCNDVDKRVNEGNYYVTSTSRIRGSYEK